MSGAEEDKVRLTLNGAGLAFERTVDAALAAQIVQLALHGERTVGQSASASSSPGRRGPPLSLREFLDQVQPKSNAEKIAAFAGFLRDHVGQTDASKDELKACFRVAGDSLPGNFHRDFQNTVQSGWIAEDQARPGKFYLTRKGEDLFGRR
jgi:hypothetical protein